jgi:hypothetical protein
VLDGGGKGIVIRVDGNWVRWLDGIEDQKQRAKTGGKGKESATKRSAMLFAMLQTSHLRFRFRLPRRRIEGECHTHTHNSASIFKPLISTSVSASLVAGLNPLIVSN